MSRVYRQAFGPGYQLEFVVGPGVAGSSVVRVFLRESRYWGTSLEYQFVGQRCVVGSSVAGQLALACRLLGLASSSA